MDARLATQYEILNSGVGAVRQGETVDSGSFDVTKNGTVQLYLYWPGSSLELELTDPDGVKLSEGYSGYSVDATSIPTAITIENAKRGTWRMGVYGKEVSMPEEPFYSVAAFTGTTAPVGERVGGGSPTNSAEGMVFVLLVMAMGCIGGVFAYTKRKNPKG